MTHEELGHLLSLADSEGVDKGQSVTLTQPELRSALQDLYNQHQKMKRDWADTHARRVEEEVQKGRILKDDLEAAHRTIRQLQEQNEALEQNLMTYVNADDKTLSACVERITQNMAPEDALHLAAAFRYLTRWTCKTLSEEKERQDDEDARGRYGYG